MKAKKIILIIAGVIACLLLVTLVTAYLMLNSGVKSAIETIGPQMTKSKVVVAGVSISPFSGSGHLTAFSVGNPEGFKSDHAVNVGKLAVDLKIGSVFSDPLIIESLSIDSPDVIYELGLGGSNIDRLTKNIDEFCGSGSTRKVIIRDFRLTNAKVRLSSLMTMNQAMPVPVPDLHLTGIGEASNGVTLQEAAAQIMKPLAANLTNAGSQLGGLAKNLGGDTIKGMDKTTKGIKSLFGK